MRKTILFLAVASVVAWVSIDTLGDNVARGQTEIHVTTVNSSQRSVTVDHQHDGFGAGDRIIAWEPLFAEDRVTRLGKAYWDCVGVGGTTRSNKKVMCVALWKVEGGQITLRYVQGPPTNLGFADFTFAVTGGTGIYANATGDGTFTGFEEYGDFVLHLVSAA